MLTVPSPYVTPFPSSMIPHQLSERFRTIAPPSLADAEPRSLHAGFQRALKAVQHLGRRHARVICIRAAPEKGDSAALVEELRQLLRDVNTK